MSEDLFENSPYGKVLLHTPLLGEICAFTPAHALDATCKGVKQARADVAFYKFIPDASVKYLADPYFNKTVRLRTRRLENVWLQPYFKQHGSNSNPAYISFYKKYVPTLSAVANLSIYIRGEYSETQLRECVLPSVTELSFSCLDTFVTPLAYNYKSLRDLRFFRIGYLDLMCISGLENLEYLEIEVLKGVKITRKIHRNPKLRHVALYHMPGNLTDLGCFPNVHKLEIHSEDVLTIDKDGLAKVFPNVESVQIKENRDLAFLTESKSLKRLRIFTRNCGDLPAGLAITSLELEGYRWGEIDPIPLPSQLQELILEGSFDAEEFPFLEPYDSLRILDIRKCDSPAYDFLQKFPNLEILKVDSLDENLTNNLKHTKALKSIWTVTRPEQQLLVACPVTVHFV